jgi:hypothetical protein
LAVFFSPDLKFPQQLASAAVNQESGKRPTSEKKRTFHGGARGEAYEDIVLVIIQCLRGNFDKVSL